MPVRSAPTLEERAASIRENTPYVRRISDDAENRDCDPVALRIHFSRFVRTRGVLQPVLTPAELFAAVAPALDAMSDDAVREYGKMVTDYLIDRPEPSAAA